jgi:hypothetical protein
MGFLLGLIAGNLLQSQDPAKRRALARALVTGEQIATATLNEVRRTAAQAAEDFQDIVAEAQASRSRTD